jgi:hypothetical protein
MGGLNSGFQGRRKITTTEVLNLDIKNIGFKRATKFSTEIKWGNGSNIRVVKPNEYELQLLYNNTINGISKNYSYKVSLDYTNCNYGGERIWFICPECGERVRKLYLKGGMFKCRSCQNLNYIIQQEDKKDYAMRSIDHKIYKIQDKLKVKRDINNTYYVQKPKGMHYKTYEKLTMQLRKLGIERDNTFLSILGTFRTRISERITA